MGGGAGKGTAYRLNTVGGSTGGASSSSRDAADAPQAKTAAPEDAGSFAARWESVVEWESINAPASRQGMAMLLAFDRAGKCDAWLWRPLHYVALHGLSNAVQVLVEAGADVNARTGGHAIVGKKLTQGTFNFFVELECQIGGKPVHVRAEEVQANSIVVMKADDPAQRWSATLGQCRCVGYSPMRQPQHLHQCCSATPLHIALENRHLEAVVALLEQKADPNLSWNDGRNMPLHTAIWQGHYRAVSELLRHAADANAADCWHRSPLVSAALCPTRKVPRVLAVMLLESGAKRAATDNAGKTAAVLARESGNPEFAETVETYVLGQWRVERPDRHFLDVTSSVAGSMAGSVAGSVAGSAAPSSRSHGGSSAAFAAAYNNPNVAAVGRGGLSPVPSLRLDGHEGSPFAAISYHPPKIEGLIRTPLPVAERSCGGGAEAEEDTDAEDDIEEDAPEEHLEETRHFNGHVDHRDGQPYAGLSIPAEWQIASGPAPSEGPPSRPQSTRGGLRACAAGAAGPTRIDTMQVCDAGPAPRGDPHCTSPAFGNPCDGRLTLQASLAAACGVSGLVPECSLPLHGHAAPDDAPAAGVPAYGRRFRDGGAFPDLGRTIT